MLTKNTCKFVLATLSTLIIGCENLPQNPSAPTVIEEEKPSPINDISNEETSLSDAVTFDCSIKCSNDTLKTALSSFLEDNNGPGYFTWLDQSIVENGKDIVTLLLNEQELDNNNPFVSLFLALTLSYPNSGFRDTNKALANLDTFEKNWSDDDANKRFSLLLKKQLEDRKRMVNQRGALRKELADVKQQLALEQDNAIEAKTQLNKLKSVEKSLLRQQSEETKKYRVVK